MESKKVRGFCAAQDSDEQSSLSYRFLLGDTSSDILKDINDRISSPLSGIWSKRVSKFLPYSEVRSRCLYQIEGEEVILHLTLARAITKVREGNHMITF